MAENEHADQQTLLRRQLIRPLSMRDFSPDPDQVAEALGLTNLPTQVGFIDARGMPTGPRQSSRD